MNEIDEHGFLDITLEDWKNIHIGVTDKLVGGATLNNILKSQFILFSKSKLLSQTLPNGLESWSELCETILIMLTSLCSIQQIFRRIFLLFLCSLSQKSSSSQHQQQKIYQDLTYGALEYLKIWFEHFRIFIPSGNIIEMSILLEEYVQYIQSIGFSRENLKHGGIGIHGIEKLYQLHDLVKSYALSSQLKPLVIKQTFLKGTWNNENEQISKLASNKKPFQDEKKKGAPLNNKSNSEKKSSNQPIINVFGVTADMLDDDEDCWDLPPPPLLLTSHLQSQQNTSPLNDEDKNPEKNYPIPRIPIGMSLLQDTNQLDLFSFDLLEIARQWTLIDHEKYLSISLASYYNCEWSLPRHQQSYLTLPIRSFIDQFNAQSCWITESLILTTNMEKRLQLYAKFIELAGYLEGLNNFNGVMAILTALQQGCVTRLKEMMKSVDDNIMKKLQRLQTLMSGLKNYQQYREVMTLRSAALPSDIEDWTYTNYVAHTGSNRLPHRVSQGLTTMSLDGVTAIVPHLGAHLAELTAISEGNSTYLSDAPHLLNLEKKRLFARCLSQLRRIHGMKYSIHSIPLIQTILLREFKKGKHLSAQESSEWSRRMYQLSLKLDMREAERENSTVSDGDESPTRFSRPTLSKAKSLLGGSWTSSRRLGESPVPPEISFAIDASTPLTKPPLAPSRGSQMTLPSAELPLRKQSSVQNQTLPTSNPPLAPSRGSQISTPTNPSLTPSRGSQIGSLSPSEPLVQNQFSVQSLVDNTGQGSSSPHPSIASGEVKKAKGLKKLLNAMKFKKRNSDSTIATNQSHVMPPPQPALNHQTSQQENINQGQGSLPPQRGSLVPKESRKMIL